MGENTESGSPRVSIAGPLSGREPGEAKRDQAGNQTARKQRTESHAPRSDRGDATADVVAQIEQRGASVVQLAYTDLLGEAGAALISASESANVLTGQLPVLLAVGDAQMYLSPDLRTLRFVPGHGVGAQLARLVCDLRPADSSQPDDCPRRCLKQVVAAARRAGLTFRVGVECRVTGSAGLEAISARSPLLLEAMIATLADSRLPGLTGRWRGADGSSTVGLGPLPPVDAADGLQLLRDAAARITSDSGLRNAESGLGLALARISISAYRGRNKLFAAGAADADAAIAFLSGVRTHARGLTALLRPAISAEDFTGWSAQQAGQPADGLRLVWERGWAGSLSIAIAGDDGALIVSGLGNSTNPYLLMAGLISAGLDGTPPTEEAAGEPVATCPPDPETAVRQLEGDECLRQGLGCSAVDAYCRAVRAHWARTVRK